MYYDYFFTEFRKIESISEGCIATANDNYFLSPEEWSVACSAVTYSLTTILFFAFGSNVSVAGTGSKYYSLCFHL